MMSLVLAAVAILLPVLIYLYAKWSQTYWQRRGVPQLPTNILFGNVKGLTIGQESQPDFFLKLYNVAKSLGEKAVGIYAGWSPIYMPVDPDLMKRIMVKDFSYFTARGMHFHETDVLSMNVFFAGGDVWKRYRTNMTSMFTSGKLKQMMGNMIKKGEEMNRLVDDVAKRDENLDMKDLVARCMTDNISEVAFGLDSNCLQNPQHKLRDVGKAVVKPAALKRTLEMVFPSAILAKLGHRFFDSDVYEYFPKMIKSSIDHREKTGLQRVDFLQLLMQLKNGMQGRNNNNSKDNSTFSESEVIGNAFIVYGGGFETSSSTTNFAMYELASNPEFQEKLRQEILDSIEKNDGKITFESIAEMEYLDKVLKDTLRKYPIFTTVTRGCTKDYVVDENLTITKGTGIIIPIFGLHRDPEYYPNPDQFDPENFSPERISSRPDGAYIPFGNGPRLCIGKRLGVLQSKVAIIQLLKDFRFSLADDLKGKPREFDAGMFLTCFKESVMMKPTKL